MQRVPPGNKVCSNIFLWGINLIEELPYQNLPPFHTPRNRSSNCPPLKSKEIYKILVSLDRLELFFKALSKK